MKQKFKEIKSYILTGISYMIPVIVASGLCMGIGRAFIGADLTNAASAGAAYWLYRTGQLGSVERGACAQNTTGIKP